MEGRALQFTFSGANVSGPLAYMRRHYINSGCQLSGPDHQPEAQTAEENLNTIFRLESFSFF